MRSRRAAWARRVRIHSVKLSPALSAARRRSRYVDWSVRAQIILDFRCCWGSEGRPILGLGYWRGIALSIRSTARRPHLDQFLCAAMQVTSLSARGDFPYTISRFPGDFLNAFPRRTAPRSYLNEPLDHPLTEAERAFIARYAGMLRAVPTTVVPMLKVAESGDPQSREAIRSLIARGWLVTSEPLTYRTEEQCVLCGKGLEIARELADHGSATRDGAKAVRTE